MAAFIGWVDPNVGGTPSTRGQSSKVAGGTIRKFVQSWTKATTDGNGTIYGLVEIPSDGVVDNLQLYNDALTGCSSVDIGLYKLETCAPGSIAAVAAGASQSGSFPNSVPQDAGAIFLSATDISSGNAQGSPKNVLTNVVVQTITTLGASTKGFLGYGLKVWELLGFTDPKWKDDSYLLGMRLNTAGSATGNLVIMGSFVQG